MPRAQTLAGLLLELPTRPVVALAIDDEDTRAMYAYAIVAAGFDVMTDDRALTVDDSRFAARPDILVADVSPGSSHGWRFVQKLKRERGTSDIPVIVVAADAGAATCERARREGCAAVCPKNCPANVLASGIQAVLSRVR